VAAIALLFDVLYLNILPFWGWVFIASIVMLVRRREKATPGDRLHAGVAPQRP
jgi:hypothetical protein